MPHLTKLPPVIKSFLRTRWLYPIIALWIGIALSGLVSTNQHVANIYEQVYLRTTDLLTRTVGSTSAEPRIAIIRITDKTLSAESGFGQRLDRLDRSVYGQLVRRLDDAGARVIAFNILFLGNGDGDADFVQAAEASYAPIIMSVGSVGTRELVKPAEGLISAADFLGHANVVFDQDLIVRRIQSAVMGEDQPILPLGMATALAYWRLPQNNTLDDAFSQSQLPNGVSLPKDNRNNLLVNFTRPVLHLNCELSDFLTAVDPQCTDEMMHDKIVFVGWGLPNGDDFHSTPVGPMNGVEIHASLTNSLLTDSLLREQSTWTQLLSIILAALLVGILFPVKKNWLIALIEITVIVSIILVGVLLYQTLNIRIDIAGPILAIVATHTILLSAQNIASRKEKQIVLQLFKNQASPQVVNILLEAAENGTLSLGGEERSATIVFFDMRSFTRISELLSPNETVEVINTYISIITKSLIEQGGTLTNNAGDQVMALFNAPINMPNHVQRAIQAAQNTMNKIEAFNQTEEADQLPVKAHFGAGVETGSVIAGNIGSEEHYSYTAIGDAVNVASRLCDIAPPATVYVGGTAASLAEEYSKEYLVWVGGHKIKGRQSNVQVYRSIHTEHVWQPRTPTARHRWPRQLQSLPFLQRSSQDVQTAHAPSRKSKSEVNVG